MTKTNEQFLNQVYDLVGSKFVFLEEYKGSKTKIMCIHECGYTWKITPNSFLKKRGCPRCAGNLMITDEEFKERVYKLVGNEYEFLEEYKSALTKIECIHKNCGYTYKVCPNHFVNTGRRCPKCAGVIKKTDEEFLKEMHELLGDDYTIIGNYINSNTPLKVKHNTCGQVFSPTRTGLLRGSKCLACFGKPLKTDEKFLKEVSELVNNEYEFLEKYKHSKFKIGVIHKECGHIYKVTPNEFLRGSRCPNCRKSKGELKISNYLESRNILFENQYKMLECKNTFSLSFDFAVKIGYEKILIEYDGEQHYRAVEFFGGEEKFELQKINDNIKNTYCKENNIPLLRIPYWDYDNIESILEKELVKYGLINVDIDK